MLARVPTMCPLRRAFRMVAPTRPLRRAFRMVAPPPPPPRAALAAVHGLVVSGVVGGAALMYTFEQRAAGDEEKQITKELITLFHELDRTRDGVLRVQTGEVSKPNADRYLSAMHACVSA